MKTDGDSTAKQRENKDTLEMKKTRGVKSK